MPHRQLMACVLPGLGGWWLVPAPLPMYVPSWLFFVDVVLENVCKMPYKEVMHFGIL